LFRTIILAIIAVLLTKFLIAAAYIVYQEIKKGDEILQGKEIRQPTRGRR